MECIACGRRLTNDATKPNGAEWTYAATPAQVRYPYCADSLDCRRDAEAMGIDALGN
jgi:hypothetical protein